VLSNELEYCLNDAFHQAREARHEYLTVEHLLYAILHDEWGIEIISRCGGEIARIKSSVERFFEEKMPKRKQVSKVHSTMSHPW